MKIFFLKLVLLFTLGISAQFAFADSRGSISISDRSFLEEQPKPVQQHEGLLKVEYENTYHLIDGETAKTSFKFHPFIQVSSLPQTWGVRTTSYYPDYYPQGWGAPQVTDPREFYLAEDIGNFYVRAGYFTLVYEGTDGVNPMDIASMKYWGDPLNAITKASAGIHTGYTSNSFEFEAAYIPEQVPSSLPGETSPWYPRRSRFPLRSEDIELRLPDRVDYKVLNRDALNHAFRHNYTARMQFRTDRGDAALAYYEGVADFPLIVPTLDVVPIQLSPKQIYLLLNPVQLTPRYYERRTVSGLVTVPTGPWIFRVASRYDQPLFEAKKYTGWSNESVFGIERSVNISDDVVTFLLQGSFVKTPSSASLISVQDIYDRAVLFGMRWPINDYWTTQLSGLRSGKDQSQFYSGQITRTFSSGWSAKLLLEILEGPPQSVLGIFDKNDRATLEVTRAF